MDVESSQMQRDEGDLTNIETESYEESDVMETTNTKKEVKNSSPESISEVHEQASASFPKLELSSLNCFCHHNGLVEASLMEDPKVYDVIRLLGQRITKCNSLNHVDKACARKKTNEHGNRRDNENSDSGQKGKFTGAPSSANNTLAAKVDIANVTRRIDGNAKFPNGDNDVCLRVEANPTNLVPRLQRAGP